MNANIITHIYAWPLELIITLMVLGDLIWVLFIENSKEKSQKILGAVITSISFLVILKYTVFGRSSGSYSHEWAFAVIDSPEFVRELVMNAFLYFPFGLGLSLLLGEKAILVAFVLSFGIEIWQYLAGTGMAQGTDVIMNTLGCFIGTIPIMIVHHQEKSKVKNP